jgi:hypothetical protein
MAFNNDMTMMYAMHDSLRRDVQVLPAGSPHQ